MGLTIRNAVYACIITSVTIGQYLPPIMCDI
jgi:hypothetical protein